MVWFEIAGRDLDALTRFYGDLLDWKVDANNPQRYGTVDTGGDGGIPGGIYDPATRPASTCRSMQPCKGWRGTWSEPSGWAARWWCTVACSPSPVEVSWSGRSSTWRYPRQAAHRSGLARAVTELLAPANLAATGVGRLDTAPNDPQREDRPMDLELVNFDQPSETRHFEKGRFDLYRVGPAILGRATYQPGWRWSEHIAPTVGTASCQVEHVGLVLGGQAVAKMDDGTERLMKAGDFFYVPPGHDSWVVGDEPYVSLHILGGEAYAAPAE